ncbi:aminodeoxychorismate lyase apoprotein [Luteibacter rhizovicinus]|uniref:Aminodeoxychorismate lyase n=1 Tax=Luteibacter rhizovicinus TaxID=242606 RepID=A0A4R3Z0Q6_9GAMM|nr:aminodeoxychorismate lyase [Luteibacter rhizovicinus]TCV97404.1 aminodeoxychorismate lyase apoprotein [Luteibacter rhizovicinus]
MSDDAPRLSVDGRAVDTISVRDRGFMYGDGLFETLRIVDGRVPLWARHVHRLSEGCARLRMPVPDANHLLGWIHQLIDGWGDATLRLTLSRGEGARGYAMPEFQHPTVAMSAQRSALPSAAAYRDGIAVRLCETRLALQPALAGMKHLNRLEQVLARSEWTGDTWGEGLMLDTDGHVVCATAANLFAVFDGELVTPPVDACGVAGVARAEILALTGATVSRLNPARLHEADEVFLTSAVRGILPVRVSDAREWRTGPITRRLQAHWCDLGLPLPGVTQESNE